MGYSQQSGNPVGLQYTCEGNLMCVGYSFGVTFGTCQAPTPSPPAHAPAPAAIACGSQGDPCPAGQTCNKYWAGRGGTCQNCPYTGNTCLPAPFAPATQCCVGTACIKGSGRWGTCQEQAPTESPTSSPTDAPTEDRTASTLVPTVWTPASTVSAPAPTQFV